MKGDIFEFFIYFFANNLKILITRGIYKSYTKINENNSFLKGKLLIDQQIKHKSTKKWKYYYEYEEFTEDNILNQILNYVCFLLKNQSTNSRTIRLLTDVLALLKDVKLRLIRPVDFKFLHFDRINSAYKPFIDFCKIIIDQSNIGFNYADFNSFYFLFDMNKLFEGFLSEFINRNQDEIFVNNIQELIEIRGQLDYYSIGKIFNKFKLYPDLYLKFNENNKEKHILLDFKYKILNPSRKNLSLSRSDLFQMFTYSQSQDEKYSNIILLFPEAEFMKSNIDRYYSHSKISCKVNLFIKTINIQKIFFFDETKNVEYNIIEWQKKLISQLNKILVIN